MSAAGPEDAGEDAAMKNLEQEYLEYLEFLEYLERNEELKNNLKEQEETEQVGGKKTIHSVNSQAFKISGGLRI